MEGASGASLCYDGVLGVPDLLLAEGADLFARGLLGEGGKTGRGAEELRQPLALIGRLPLLQRGPTMCARHLGGHR